MDIRIINASLGNMYLENKKINQLEIKEKRIVLKSKPLKLGIILNNTCNLNCIMCPNDRHLGDKVLSKDAFEKIYKLLPYVDEINWQGGEIFYVRYLKEEFERIFSYPHIHHGIVTNGLLLDKDWIEMLVNLKVSFVFSIDSVIKETYEFIRGGGKFINLIERIELLNETAKKHNKVLDKSIYVVVMKSNYKELDLFVDFAHRFGFNRISFNPIRFVKGEENIFNNLTEEMQALFAKSFEKISKSAAVFNIGISWSLPYVKVGKEFSKTSLEKINRMHTDCFVPFCSFPWRNMWIDASRNGDIFPDCFCLKAIGNIYKDCPLSVWNNEKIQKYRMNILENNWKLCNPDCKSRALSVQDNF